MSEDTVQDPFRTKVMFGGVDQTFPGIQAFLDWVNQLIDDWQWTGSDPTGAPFWQRFSPSLVGARKYLTNALQNSETNPTQARQYVDLAHQQIEKVLAGPTPFSDHRAIAFLKEIQNRAPELRGMITCLMAGVEPPAGGSHTKNAQAVFEFELYRRGVSAVTPARDALQELETQYKAAISKLDGTRHDSLIGHRLFMESMAAKEAEIETAISQSNQQRTDAWANLLDNCEGRLRRLETTYDAYMALSKPAAYWIRKRFMHRIAAGVLTLLLIAAMATLGRMLYLELNEVAPIIQAQLAGQKTGSTPLQLGTLVALSTVGFWFVRILVKLFLSQIHLENDASERITMIRTYLALSRGGKLKDDDLKAIVTAVFRPTGDGIVKDEGLSLPLTELLFKK